jgi:hypothetical protein
MSAEQRKAAGERLAKARERRAAANPPQYKNVHPSVLALPEGDTFYFKNIRKWIATQRELLSGEKKLARKEPNAKGVHARIGMHEGYIRNLERFLRDGDYCDDYYGEHQQTKIKWKCITPAYDRDGNMKRTHGVWYADLGTVWSDYEAQ